MPAYDRPMHIRVEPQAERRVGAVIQFESTDARRIQDWLDRAAAAGIIKSTVAQSYDARYGGPVWYIP
jgi:hypothetical protein